MLRRLVDAGHLHRNGHARCGGCRSIEDRCDGGRTTRKREGWTYHAALGWLCRSCHRWARDVADDARTVQPSSNNRSSSRSSESSTPVVRGFGFLQVSEILGATRQRSTRKGARRRKLARIRAEERARSAAGLPVLDRSAHRSRSGRRS